MKVWVTRGKKKDAVNWLVLIWPVKPIWNGHCDGWISEVDCEPMEVRIAGFKVLYGFTPRAGTCKQHELPPLKEPKQ